MKNFLLFTVAILLPLILLGCEADVSSVKAGSIFTVLTAIISIASVIAAITPSMADNIVLNILAKLVNVLAVNFGKAKNKDAD